MKLSKNKNSSKKQLNMVTSELKEVSKTNEKEVKEIESEEENIRVTAGLPKSVHERLLDLAYFEGLTLEEIMQEAAEMILEKYNPKERPQKVKERRKKPGRPRKESNNQW
ncbi:hypothetical protein WJR50_30520 [Catalinimonas sp. 4WD22]|uniref:hypothetical protein n=1 Tax=Catalinimonas locisalis TaxID=3133978 RepID=UPI0031014C37